MEVFYQLSINHRGIMGEHLEFCDKKKVKVSLANQNGLPSEFTAYIHVHSVTFLGHAIPTMSL